MENPAVVFEEYRNVPFSYFMTISSAGMGQYKLPIFGYADDQKMNNFMELVNAYLKRLSRKVYGKYKHREKRIRLVGCFEDRHKGGFTRCQPHLHALIVIEPEFLERFTFFYEKEWKKTVLCYRFNNGNVSHPSFVNASIELSSLNNFDEAVAYCTKHFLYNDFAPIESINSKYQISL